MPITVQVVKYPSTNAVALGRGLWEPRNKMVRRCRGGAIEPPKARKTSCGRKPLMNLRRSLARATLAQS
jgi:hypothetical protein